MGEGGGFGKRFDGGYPGSSGVGGRPGVTMLLSVGEEGGRGAFLAMGLSWCRGGVTELLDHEKGAQLLTHSPHEGM